MIAPDRPGLLAKIADVFVEMNITIINARITTLGERVEDVFEVSKNGKGIGEGCISQTLMNKICQDLDQHVERVGT